MTSSRPTLLVLAVFVLILPRPAAGQENAVDFNRDIRPLLSDRCYACHGPNEASRQGGFRLDERESAYGEADSGSRPVVPGDLSASELIRRITSEDPDERMPPADSNKKLDPDEIDQIRRWVESGAPWNEHWSLVAPQRPDLPTTTDRNWPHNAIDYFILAQLESMGQSPSEPARREALIRRVTFDLTGLAPTPSEVDAFLADRSPGAYERVVDRLLLTPQYGEHRARFWLDAARYGDTHGLHLDNYREMWPYRDWVVAALNNNMPYDQFVIEQLAGDLLPNPTLEQLIATGFNRCHVTTNEGGSITEEVYVRNVVDRVVTTGTVFMGMTLECTRCHDHKYDPFTMKDFYSLFAYFNSIDGIAMDGNKKDPAPIARVPSAEQQARLTQLKDTDKVLTDTIADIATGYGYVEPESAEERRPSEPVEVVWIDDHVPAGATEEGGWKFVGEPSPVFSGDKASVRTASGLSQHFFTGAKPALKVAAGDRLFAYVYLDPENPPKQIMLQWNDGNWDHRAYWGGNEIQWGNDGSSSRRRIGDLPEPGAWVRLDVGVADVGLKAGSEINGWAFTQFDGTVYWDMAGIVTAEGPRTYTSFAAWIADQRAAKDSALPKDIQALVKNESLEENEHKRLVAYYVEHIHAPARSYFEPLHKDRLATREQIKSLEASIPTTLIYRERAEPRPSFMLNRGEYDQQREQVERRIPSVFPPLPEGAPNNRLGLAQWLIDRSHPLTARVAVNRYWQQFMGVGLVKTSEDFGSQGQPPSHPELLDWLSVEFIESGWDIRAMMKLIVMSATYRQSAGVTAAQAEQDPENRWLARGPRFRLDAETLRDQALQVSGLLVTRLGGPSVKPPQPDGLWLAVGYSGSNTVRFKADEGPDKVHRRSLYTFIKRTAPPPQMSVLDAPSRESCSMRRERTNTPLQALLLMNDPQFVEAARAFARRAIDEAGDSVESRATFMFRWCTARKPDDNELKELAGLVEDLRTTYESDPAAARQLAAIAANSETSTEHAIEMATWTMVANLILNLDETLSK